MPATNRRKFITNVAAGVAASTLFSTARSAVVGANERVRIGVIGAGNQGKRHHLSLSTLPDAKIAYVCDIDEQRVAEGVARTGAKPVTDLRRILDDPSIDAVTIATPDHWHVPAALLAGRRQARLCGKALLLQLSRRPAAGQGSCLQAESRLPARHASAFLRRHATGRPAAP